MFAVSMSAEVKQYGYEDGGGGCISSVPTAYW